MPEKKIKPRVIFEQQKKEIIKRKYLRTFQAIKIKIIEHWINNKQTIQIKYEL